MPRQIRDMIVVITGASSGIGRALAQRLSAKGAKLTLAARRVDRLNQLNEQLGGSHQVVAADVSKQGDCESLIADALKFHGRIDTVVCNAGYGLAKPVSTTTSDEILRLFQTNLFGTTDIIRAAVPILSQQPLRDGYRGQIMIVSSAVARRGIPSLGAYSATKAAQLSIAEALRVELRPVNIAVTSVHPVGTKTEFFDIAGEMGNTKMPDPVPGEVRQTAETVARKMSRAIEKPRPEVWPFSPSRWLISIATLVPGLVDRGLRNYRTTETSPSTTSVKP